MNVPGDEVAVLVVDDALEERHARAVREAAADLTFGEQRVEQPPGVVDADVVEHAHCRRCRDRPRRRRRRRGTRAPPRRRPVVRVGRLEVRRRVEGGLVQSGLDALREAGRVPVARAGEPSKRDRLLAVPGLRRELDVLGSQPSWGRRSPSVRASARGDVHGAGTDAGEARGVVAGGDCPGARGGVAAGDDRRSRRARRRGRRRRPAPPPSGGPVPAASSRGDRDPAERVDRDRARPRRCRTSAACSPRSSGGLRERDVAHVRDRRLDHAGDADADEPAVARAASRSARARPSARARAHRSRHAA